METPWQYEEATASARLAALLGPAEALRARTRALEALLALTDRRLLVIAEQRAALDVPIERIRRIQFDIERGRPASFVVVPHDPADTPQILSIPPAEYRAAAEAISLLGEQLALLEA